ncbi:MAG: HAMP domain-containing protein [Oceanospirillaceae bacterium]|jgi:methyl-accepting chemotaxis protein|nr:HAMP domain-containing protein [Oceanospirillaceae bacterium]
MLNWLTNLSISKKLITAFLFVGIIPFTVLGITALDSATQALEQQSFNQLEAVRGIKKAQIEGYFQSTQDDMDVLRETSGTIRQEAMNKLVAVRDNKKNAIQLYFDTVRDQVITTAENPMIINGMRDFSAIFGDFAAENGFTAAKLKAARQQLATYYSNDFSNEYNSQNGNAPDTEYMLKFDNDSVALQHAYISNNPHPLGSKEQLDHPGDDSYYSNIHQSFHPSMRTFLQKFGYYDIFLVDIDSGDIVYSVFKELDYSTSLIDGPYADTNFGQVFRDAAQLERGEVAFVDFAQYRPSYEAPASFIASPIFEGDKATGVLIFQLPLDRITNVMSERAGLGGTGETYLVGQDHLMRSDSYLDPVNHTVIASFRNPELGNARTEAVDLALAGESGTKVIIDYNGNPVLSAYSPYNVLGLEWALLSEINVAEAFVPHVEGAEKDYYNNYIEKYGYYDIFLINPDGYIFYTAAKEADYQTNLIDGAYADSNLGKLFRQVSSTGEFGFVDFEPYAPSNGEPASFIAQPIKDATGKVEMVVALQIPLDGINNVMGERSGMGETGKSYLVGQDYLMRSNSFLDPINHSVNASFANPQLGSVDSDAVKAVFAGHTGSKIITDYNGNPVLSSYTAVNIHGTQWALMAEIDEAEAFASIEGLKAIMLGVAIAGIILILIFAYFISGSISRPIRSLSGLFAKLDDSGDFSLRSTDITSKDEIGQMAEVVNQHLESLQQAIDAANKVVTDVAQGQFENRIELDFKGDLAKLKTGVNNSADSVEQTMHALKQVLNAIATGNFGYRLDGVEVESNFRSTLTHTMETMEQAIGEINQVMNAAALGHFDLRVNTPLKGDLDQLKMGVNNSITAIAEALTETTAMAKKMAYGDLTQRITGDYNGRLDDLKTALNSSVENMEKTVSAVLNAIDSVASNASAISRGSDDLSQRTSEQSASLEETSSSMEEMAATIEHNTNRANEASGLVEGTRVDSSSGVEVVNKAVQAMSDIEKSSGKIVSIITLIDGIAFQTNLLALNASVEAARAGEHGRGFAVVAGEVRTLAQRAADAAKDIKGLIEDSSSKVQEGRSLVNQTGESLASISESITKVSDIVTEIATATGQQTTVVNQINSAVGQLENVNQQNVALVEESSASSYSLSDQTKALKQQFSFFKINNWDISTPTVAPLKSTEEVFSAEALAEITTPSSAPTPQAATGYKDDDWQEF